MLKLVNTELAESDLLEIWLYTAEEWNLGQADTYIAQIGKSVNKLIDYPELGKDRSDL